LATSHRVIFKFDGLTAEAGELDGSDAEHFTSGARRLLALQATFYTKGKVPALAVSKTDHYRITWATRYRGSVVDPWSVAIIGGAVGTVLGHYSIKALDYSFAEFFAESVGSCIFGRAWSAPPFERIEPTFSRAIRTNSDEFSDSEAKDNERELLRAYTRRSLISTARPVGRSASTLDIFVDERFVGRIDEATLRRLANEEAISDYVDRFHNRPKPNRMI